MSRHSIEDDQFDYDVPPSRNKIKLVVAMIVALVLLIAAAVVATRGGDDSTSQASGDSSTTIGSSAASTTTTTVAQFIAPLTGLAQPSGALLTRPALTVKIDGSPNAMPQVGLDLADVMWEEQVEGGAVRYLAMFHSQDAPVVGPVRSVRPVDPDIIGPSGGLFAYSGGIQIFINKLRSTPGIKDIGADVNGDDYYRRRGRSAPHNLFSSTTDLYSGAPALPPAKDIFQHYGPTENISFGGNTAVPTNSAVAKISNLTTTSWTWDAQRGQYLRGFNGSKHVNEEGVQLGYTNVVLVLTPYVNSGEFDPVGTPVPEGKIIGNGDGYVLAGGKSVKVKWSKPDATSPITFTDPAGAPLKLIPGTTWATLVPTTGSITIS